MNKDIKNNDKKIINDIQYNKILSNNQEGKIKIFSN